MTKRIQIDHVLCPVDFSVFSARALRHAAALAKRFESRLTVLHVVPQWTSYAYAPAYVPEPVLANPVLRDRIRKDVDALTAEAVESGVPVDTLVREAQPWREIEAVAAELPADLVVMGTHGRGGFEELLMGSVAEKVLQRARCPVMTVCHEEGRTWEAPGLVRNVLCATDLSPASAPTVEYALSLAAEFEATLTLVHVLDRPAALDGPAFAHFPPPAEVLSQHEEIARRELRQAVPEDARAWCKVVEHVVPGRARDEILRLAATERADVVVMGAHRRGPLTRALLGSTSHHVVRAASCPVLTVRVAPDAGAVSLAPSTAAGAIA